MRESKYRVVIDFGSERVNVETVGVKDSEQFMDFVSLLGTVFPRYLVDFFSEYLKEESQEDFLVTFLMSFMHEYLDVTGLSPQDFVRYVSEDVKSKAMH